MPTLKTMVEEIKVKSDEMEKVLSEAGPEMDFDKVTTLKGDDVQSTEDKVKWLQEREKDLGKLIAAMSERIKLEKTRDHSSELSSVLGLLSRPANMIAAAVEAGKGEGGGTDRKGLMEPFVKDGWTSDKREREFEIDVDYKTLFQTSTSWAPETTRTGRVIDKVTRPLQVSDVVPFSPTDQSAIVYMEETTLTLAAAEVGEGLEFAESAFALTERTSTVRKVAHFVPATDEQLEDEAAAGGYLDRRMRFGLLQRVDRQILIGGGTGVDIDGIINVDNVQTQAKGTDPVPDAIYKATTKVRVTGGAAPDAVMIHSNDWQQIRLLRTSDGVYIWGNPSEVGAQTIWGLPVVQNEILSEGTALVGDFANFVEVRVKRGVTVKVSDSHSDYFIKGKQAIRADMRIALPVYRPVAFCTVTGI